MKTYISLILIFLALLIGFGIGALAIYNQDFKYRDASIMTCDYANKLANISNYCTKTLKLYTGTDYDTINYLDCDKLKDRT